MRVHPCVGWLELFPPCCLCWDALGPGWFKLGLAVALEQAELCQARLGVLAGGGHVPAGIWAPAAFMSIPNLGCSPWVPYPHLSLEAPWLPPWKG